MVVGPLVAGMSVVRVVLLLSSVELVGVVEESVGVVEESVGVVEESVGVVEESVGVVEESVGVVEESVGVVTELVALLVVLDGIVSVDGVTNVGRLMIDSSIAATCRLLYPGKDTTVPTSAACTASLTGSTKLVALEKIKNFNFSTGPSIHTPI